MRYQNSVNTRNFLLALLTLVIIYLLPREHPLIMIFLIVMTCITIFVAYCYIVFMLIMRKNSAFEIFVDKTQRFFGMGPGLRTFIVSYDLQHLHPSELLFAREVRERRFYREFVIPYRFDMYKRTNHRLMKYTPNTHWRVQSGDEEIHDYNHIYNNLVDGFVGNRDRARAGRFLGSDMNTRFQSLRNRLSGGANSGIISDDMDYIIKLIEDVFTFLDMLQPRVSIDLSAHPNNPCLVTEAEQRLLDQDTFTSRLTRAVINFAKLRTNKSAIRLTVDNILPYVLELFSQSNEYEVQTGIEDYLMYARGSVEATKNVSSSPIFSKIYKCCMYLLCYSIFDNFGITMDRIGYSKLEQAALKKKFGKTSDFLYTLADTVLFIFERGYQVYITKDVNTIFHSGGVYSNLYETARQLHTRFSLLNNPEEHGFSESEYRASLDDTIEKLESVAKYSYCQDTVDKRIIRETLSGLQMLRCDLNTQSAARKERRAPYSLLLFGDSGIGKTTLTNVIRVFFAKYNGLPEGSEYVYTRNSKAKYWDGFRSSCHTIVMDDAANEDPSLKDSASVDEIIQVINNCAFCPDQAALEQKGNTPMRARLVLGTTNVKDLNTWHFFSVPSAVQRRFPYIVTVTVKDELKDERGMLHTSRVLDDGAFPDYWWFKVELVKPVPIVGGKRLAELEVLHDRIGMGGFLDWFKESIDRFNADQNRVQECLRMISATQLCVGCYRPETICKCQHIVQSGDEYFDVWHLLVLCLAALSAVFLYIYQSEFFQRLLWYYKYYMLYERHRAKWFEFQHRYMARFNTAKRWMSMGERTRSSFNQPAAFVTLGIAATTIFALYRQFRKFKPQTGHIDEVGRRPIPEVNARENVWYNNDIDLTPANFSRESASSKSMEFSDFCKKISDNVIHFRVYYDSRKFRRKGKAICIGGHIYLTNNHNLPVLDDTVIDIVSTCRKGLGSNMQIPLCESDVHRIPDKDLAIIILRELPPKKKIIQYFQLGESKGVFNGKYISREPDGSVRYRDVKNIRLQSKAHQLYPDLGIDAHNCLWDARISDHTTPGDCGSVLVIDSAYGYSIVGLHFLASGLYPDMVKANFVKYNLIKEHFDKFSNYGTGPGTFDFVSAPSAKRNITDLHHKSPLRYIPEGNVEIYGSFAGFRGKHKSEVKSTPMQKYLDFVEYPVRFTKPEMASWVPWSIALKDLVNPIRTLYTNKLNKCVDNYKLTIDSRIKVGDLQYMLHPLDNFTAINGACVTYIDKLNRNSSAGNPWKKSKRFFMESMEPLHDMPDPVKVSDEIMDRVREMEMVYASGERVNPNFCAHLKDEPVSFEKALVGKTRVFTGAPFDWIIVVRKQLLSFARLLQNNRFAFEAGPGTIAQSLEWQEIRDYIITHGESRIVAGDYKAFDKKMSPKEILAAFDIMAHYCELSGNYTTRDLTIIRGIAEDTAFALVDYNGDLIQLFGSNPSGNPLTVILNSIVNSLRMRYVYLLLSPNKDCSDFNSNVALMTYGDDNIMSVSPRCDWFNHTSISDTFKLLDIGYTMADKSAESVPYIHIDNSSFLKRTWRYDEDLRCHMAPLDHESIVKMLTVWTRSKTVTEEAQGIDIISTALREYFFYGREVFESKRLMLKKLVDDLNWGDWEQESTFPTYKELCDQFVSNSKDSHLYNRYFSDYKY